MALALVSAIVETLEREAHKAKMRAIKVKLTASEREGTCIEALTEVKHLRKNIKQIGKTYASKKTQLTEASTKSNKATEEEKWGATRRVALFHNELHMAQERIAALENLVDSGKVAKEARWGATEKVVRL
ncbi:hypothetical protein COCNU_scaffold010390G000010 [Cocos nucifera]|nr:hypothetical protein [Cocos nucifera]